MYFKFFLMMVIILIVSIDAKSHKKDSESDHIHRIFGKETVDSKDDEQGKMNLDNVTFSEICQELRALNETQTRSKRFVFYVQSPVFSNN